MPSLKLSTKTRKSNPMKRYTRRSAWLGFVACGLIGTAVCSAESSIKPLLSITKASAAAEAELQKRGLAEDHVIASISLSNGRDAAFYVARIEPRSHADGADQCMAFRIDMAGNITATAS
jgi:hypothetical protein